MNIVVRATNWVGDAVMNLPALNGIIGHFAGGEVHVLARPVVAPIFRSVDGVASVLPYSGGRRRTARGGDGLGFWEAVNALKRLRPQKAILFQNAFEAALVAFAARIPERIGYARDCRRLLLTKPVPFTKEVKRLHHVDYYLNILRSIGIDDALARVPKLTVPNAEQERADKLLNEALGSEAADFVGVCPGAAFGPAKRWPAESFAELIERLWETRGIPFVLLGGKDEAELADGIAEGTSAKCVNLAGKTSLMEAAAVLSRAKVVVSNDSGLMHIAAAVGAPVIAIFASTNPAATGPLGDRHVVIESGVECAPCLDRTCKRGYVCMKAITVDRVLAPLHRLL